MSEAKRKTSANLLYWIITVAVITLIVISNVEAQPGGMIMLSDVTDDSDNAKDKNEKKFGESPMTVEKAEKHIKIAESHIQEGVDSDESESKVTRRDKAINLQNPAKHASEERLLYFLLDQYTLSGSDVNEKVEILKNLENFSHKSENGRDLFKSTNALKDILLPALNSTEAEIRKGACGVFAIAAQNNAYVQHKAWENGVLRLLIQILNFDQHVRPKALFALSSLLRNFPEAQQKFILEGGSAALVKVAFLSETRKRALTLITDLLIERKNCLIDDADGSLGKRTSKTPSEDRDHIDHILSSEDPCDKQKLLQSSLLVNGWCDVLRDTLDNFPGFDDDDQILILEAVSTSLTFCQNLSKFEQTFQNLLAKFKSEEDYDDIVITLEHILSTIGNTKIPYKEEL